ncbi:hypothetical protein B0F90DRAFT_1671031 [Multifurca ochricompacta]|uniref:Acid phosphatase n=1 Tax=Multifurca ochricompacta TaxID=376703 RepID=A0AAD4QJT4_9AGAM|nr:hypothetical protein B0F90DRAFT_1671031 [Multifurca ochricompacta]
MCHGGWSSSRAQSGRNWRGLVEERVKEDYHFGDVSGVATVPTRPVQIRNFNDFAVDVNASTIPQWLFVTPNMVNDGHDTDITYASAWLDYWLVQLLFDKRFNDEHTLILLMFDENKTKSKNN